MRLLLLLFFVIYTVSIIGQTTSKVHKIVTLLPEQSIYLHSTSNGYFYGGKSRVTHKIDLPPNTIEWYYIYSTTPNEGDNQNLGLVSQLTRIVDPTGLTSVAVNSLTAPSGTGGLVDIYVMGYENKLAFEKKDALGAWVYDRPGGWPEGTSENAKEGKKKIDDIKSGTIYLGLKNPHSNEGVNVTIEIAAIVEFEEVDMTKWSIESKENIYRMYKNNLIESDINEDIASEIASCFITTLTKKYSPEDFNNLSESEIDKISEKLAEEYLSSMQGGEKTDEQKKGATIGGMGWSAYENGDIEKAINYSLKALEYDNTLGWVHGNLGLFYLIKNDELTALDYYLEAITQIKKDKINDKHYFTELINDIENAKQKYPELQGYDEIIEQLRREGKN